MAIGQRHYRVDAPGKVIGASLYPGDLTAENLLYARVVFSGQPHARLLKLDVSRAEAAPGVVAVFTARDVPNNEYGLVIADQPVFVGPGSNKSGADVSRWEGDHIALIVAETAEAAAAAGELIDAQWEPLPVITDARQAMNDELLLHPEHGSNVVTQYRIRKGDMAAGWAAADVIIDGVYETPPQEHAYLQPEAGLSYIDDAGRITVEVAGQWTHEDQLQIMHALNLTADQVRVIYPAIGGAFGGREDMSVQIVLALAAWRLDQRGIRRPIRIIWSREESVVGHHKRHRSFVRARLGATKEGLLTAVEAELILDAGAYNYTSNKVLGNAHLTVAGPYVIPNAQIDSYAVYTNNVPGGAFRGFGAPQGTFVAECQMNKLAERLGMDPVELRLKNVLREGSISVVQTPLPPGVSLPYVIERCAEAAGWGGEDGRSAHPFSPFLSLPADPTQIRRGRGFACAFKNVGYSFGFPERCEATIELHGGAEVERVVLRHAAAEVGQGTHTALKQMAAEATGVPLAQVELILSDTAETGDSGSVSASRMSWMAGNAIRGAAESARQAWTDENRPAIGHFRFVPAPTEPLHPETGVSNPNITYGYVAEVVDVVVDVETGHVHVERVVCADDVGKAINPTLIEGQIEGAVVQAHGYAVTEQLQLADGHILNPRLSTYLIPGIQDIPDEVDSVILEYPDPSGPWGVRGMAEMPFIPYAPALIAALHEATGVWFDRFPLTPAHVLAGLQAAGRGPE